MIERIQSGSPIDNIFIFDAHAHFGDMSVHSGRVMYAPAMLETMDALGVNQLALSSNISLAGDVYFGNEQMKEVVSAYPERFYGYVTVHPQYPYLDMLNSYVSCPNILGVKIHAMYHGVSIDNEMYLDAYDFANQRELPVLFHTWGPGEVSAVTKIAKEYPHLKAIIAHSAFTSYSAKLAVIDAMHRYDNVYADTTISITYDGALEWIVERIGSDRLLYGSDMPCFDCRQELGRVLLSKLSDGEKEKILGLNAKKLFNLYTGGTI